MWPDWSQGAHARDRVDSDESDNENLGDRRRRYMFERFDGKYYYFLLFACQFDGKLVQ